MPRLPAAFALPSPLILTRRTASLRSRRIPPNPPTPPRIPARTLASAAHPDVSQTARLAPSAPGVYIFRDGAPPAGRALYVGKARSLRARLRSYIAGAAAPRTLAMVAEARALELLPTDSEAAALALEAGLVRELRPAFNVLLKDDKRHPYLVLSGGEFPRLVKTRRVPARARRGGRVYGPFVHEGRLNRVCEAIGRAYPLRHRATPLHADRPCLNYGIGLCAGPCQGLVSKEEYARMTGQVDKLLTGRVGEVLAEVAEEMKEAVGQLDFERASKLRDRRDIVLRTFVADADEEYVSTRRSGEQVDIIGEAAAAASVNDPAAASSKDVVASVGTRGGSSAKIALLQVRDGSVVNRLIFTAGSQTGYTGSGEEGFVSSFAEEALSATLVDHYARAEHAMELPEEIVLATPMPSPADAALLADALSSKRGKAVRVFAAAPASRAIADMAVRNAEFEAKLDESRMLALRQEFESLQGLLADFYPSLRCGAAFRIESYDISHMGGGYATGSVAVLVDGVPLPREYRRIILDECVSSPGRPDDYASMKATLCERFSKDKCGDASSLPDLIVIDGGKGQLSSAVDALASLPLALDIPIVSLAKRIEEVFVPGEPAAVNAAVGMVPGVRLLCRARDEAHRNGVASTRRLHGKAALRSGLDGVPGIGASKRDALLKHFPGGAAAVAVASVEALEGTPGIGLATAERIHEHFASFNGRSRKS